MCKKVPVCLKCVFASRIDFSLNLVPLYTTVKLRDLQVKNPRTKRSIFVMDNFFFRKVRGIQSTKEMAFKRTVPLREFSISRHQI